MSINHPTRALLPLFVAGALALTACGSSGGGSSGGGQPAGASATTVAVRSTDKGQVLTDSSGRTLYVSEQEKSKVLCTSSACTTIWVPLTVSTGMQPTGPMQVSGTLSTIKRPDGSRQVALDGRPLYRFVLDHAAGEVNGEGQHDSFDGTNFAWLAATPAGTMGSAPSAAPSTGYSYGSGGGGGGY